VVSLVVVVFKSSGAVMCGISVSKAQSVPFFVVSSVVQVSAVHRLRKAQGSAETCKEKCRYT